MATASLVVGVTDLGLASSTDTALMIPWVLFLGATAQLIAGIIDFKRRNIFGGIAFTLYALFWYSVALTLYIPITGVGFDLVNYTSGLLSYLIISLILTIASLMTNKILVVILIFIDLAYVALILNLVVGLSPILAGVFLIGLAISSFYGASAVLLNTMGARTILPVGKALWTPKKKDA